MSNELTFMALFGKNAANFVENAPLLAKMLAKFAKYYKIVENFFLKP